MKAVGEFEVELNPLESHVQGSEGMSVGRMSIAKKFRGAIEGTSQGEMLSARTAVEGSASYVAMEQATATLNGRAGTFMLVHLGTMTAEGHRLVLEVVPDSGTGELTGLSGTMDIEIVDGTHRYVLDYAIG